MRNARSTRRNARPRTVNYTADDALLEHALIGKRMSLFLFEALTTQGIADARAQLEQVLSALRQFSEALPEQMTAARDAMAAAVKALDNMKRDLRRAAAANDDSKMSILTTQLTQSNKLTIGLMEALNSCFSEAYDRISKLAQSHVDQGSFDGYEKDPPLQDALGPEDTDTLKPIIEEIFNEAFKSLPGLIKGTKSAVKAEKNKTRGIFQKLKNIFSDSDDYLDAIERACVTKLYTQDFFKASINDITTTSESFDKTIKSLSTPATGKVVSSTKGKPKAQQAEPPPDAASLPDNSEATTSATTTGAESTSATAEPPPSPSPAPEASSETSPAAPEPAVTDGNGKISSLGALPANASRKNNQAAEEALKKVFGKKYDEVMSAMPPNFKTATARHKFLINALAQHKRLTAAGVVFESKKSPDGLIVERWNVLAGTDKKR